MPALGAGGPSSILGAPTDLFETQRALAGSLCFWAAPALRFLVDMVIDTKRAGDYSLNMERRSYIVTKFWLLLTKGASCGM